MKRLSQSQAQACEHSESPKYRCRCRCGGACHGAARVQNVAELPADDPHAPALVCCAVVEGKKCRRKAVVIDERWNGSVCAAHATGRAKVIADMIPVRPGRKQLTIFDAMRGRAR